MRFLLLSLIFLLYKSPFAQLPNINTFEYTTIQEEIQVLNGNLQLIPNRINTIINQHGKDGWELVDWKTAYYRAPNGMIMDQTDVAKHLNFHYGVIIIFKRSSSIREAQLNQLISDLRTKIDNTAKRYVDSATASIELYMLNTLDTTINSVLKPEYISKITQAVLEDVRRSYDKIIEGLKKEIEELKKPRQ